MVIFRPECRRSCHAATARRPPSQTADTNAQRPAGAPFSGSGPLRPMRELLDGDGGAGALELRLGPVRGLLVDALEQRLGRAVHEVLGLLEPEARQGPDLLDDLDLFVARGFEDDVELVLLLCLLGSRGAA